MKSTDQYALYVINHDDLKKTEKHFFCTPTYCLIYTNKRPPKVNQKITKLSLLSDEAKRWLNGCIEEIRAQYLIENEEENLQKATEFYNAFVSALEEERKNAAENKTDTEG